MVCQLCWGEPENYVPCRVLLKNTRSPSVAHLRRFTGKRSWRDQTALPPKNCGMCLQDYLRREHLKRASRNREVPFSLIASYPESLVIEVHCRVEPGGPAVSGRALSHDVGQRLLRGVQYLMYMGRLATTLVPVAGYPTHLHSVRTLRKHISWLGHSRARVCAASSSESALAVPKPERTSTSPGIGIRLMIAMRTVSHVHCDHHFYLLTNQ
jgi:hypothetical protein